MYMFDVLIIMNVFLAVLGLHCCAGAFSSSGERAFLSC